MIIITAIILFLLAILCFTPTIIALLDVYWWMMTEHTISSFTYSGERISGMILFLFFGVVLFVLSLSAVATLETPKVNKDGNS